MKRFLSFLARLTVISLFFVPFLSYLHDAYRSVLGSMASVPTDGIRFDGFNNLYTFLVLILAIPAIPLKKRTAGVFTGVALFLFTDFFMAAIWPTYLKTPNPSLTNMAVTYGWLVTAHYLLPFLLWFAFAYRQIDQLFRGVAPRNFSPNQ